MDKVITGIRVVDEKLGGGFTKASSVLLFSESPSEKRMFAEQFIAGGLRNEETCLYIDFYRFPTLARSHFKRYGTWEDNNLVIVDAVSSRIMMPSAEKYAIQDVLDMRDIRSVVRKAWKEEKPTRVTLDSLDFLVDRFPKDSVIDLWQFMKGLSQENNSVFLTLFINWILDKREIENLKRLADCVIEFKTERIGKRFMNLMRITDGGEPKASSSNWIPFTFEGSTGVVAYLPRIMVTGSVGSGKTSFIRSLCSRSVMDEKGNIGEGVDRGKIDISNVETEVFGVPGDERFANTFRLFSREVSGIFLLLDSTRPEDIERGKEIVASSLNEVPLVVVANKQNLAGAMSVEEIRKKMELPEKVPIVGMSSSQEESASMALQHLLRLMATV
ncbi:MAG: ATPase domain-containing protein [Thermoplasmata archaeon]